MAYIHNDRGNNKFGTKVTSIRGKRGVIQSSLKAATKTTAWTYRLLRVYQAKKILFANAKLLKIDYEYEVSWYVKHGGWVRASQDFWKMSAYGEKYKLRQSLNGDSSVSKYGIVGDNTVELIKKFSVELPYPAIFMCKTDFLEKTGGNNFLVLYKK